MSLSAELIEASTSASLLEASLAAALAEIDRLNDPPPPPPIDPHEPPPPAPVNEWRRRYYLGKPDPADATKLIKDGGTIASEVTKVLNDDYVTGSPANVPGDNWLMDADGYFDFDVDGTYDFGVRADDGVRVWVTKQGTTTRVNILDQWRQQAPSVFLASIDLPKGRHLIEVEYYELVGGATCRVTWNLRPATPPPPVVPVTTRLDGFYRGSAWPPGPKYIEAANLVHKGKPWGIILEHVDIRDWAHHDDSGWILWRLAGNYPGEVRIPQRLILTAGMMPWGASLVDAAKGAYEAHWKSEFQQIVDYGFGDTILRIGHEMNCCYEWGEQAKANPKAYIDSFKRMVAVARGVAGNRFQISWNPIFGQAAQHLYPGKDFCDYIDLDVYAPAGRIMTDADWNNYLNAPGGLNWHRDIAKAEGKLRAFSETGLWGFDDPGFITRMRQWTSAPDVAWDMVYAHIQHDFVWGAQFPKARAAYTATVT